MVYCISIKPKALKALELINDLYYSKTKEAIYSLSANPRPVGYIKLKGGKVTVFVLPIIELFMRFLMMYLL